MAVNSVSSSVDLTASYGVKSQQEQQQEVHHARHDVKPDNDSDDRAASESKPSVNTQGETVGKIINTKA